MGTEGKRNRPFMGTVQGARKDAKRGCCRMVGKPQFNQSKKAREWLQQKLITRFNVRTKHEILCSATVIHLFRYPSAKVNMREKLPEFATEQGRAQVRRAIGA